MSNFSLRTPLAFLREKFSIETDTLDDYVPSFTPSNELIERSVAESVYAIANLPKVATPLPYQSKSNNSEFPSPSLDELRGSTSSKVLDKANIFALSDLSSTLNIETISLKKNKPKSILVLGLKNPYFILKIISWASANNIRNIAFADTSVDNLYSSFYQIDWQKVSSFLADNQISSSFFFDKDLHSVISSANEWFCGQSFYSGSNFYYFIDRVFNSHAMPAIVYLKKPSTIAGLNAMGFYEDNINMVINTFSSFNSSFPFYASKSKPTSSNILLIGSGPSLWIQHFRNL